jgi:hypothetical protein
VDEEGVAAAAAGGRRLLLLLLLMLVLCSPMEMSLGGGVGGTSLSEVRRRAEDMGTGMCGLGDASGALGSTLLDEDRIGREYDGWGFSDSLLAGIVVVLYESVSVPSFWAS